MLIKSIASSSKGNCYYISNGISHLLLEAGVKLDKLREKKIDLVQLDGCLITHEHKDHSKYVKDVARYTNIYSSEKTLDLFDLGLNSYKAKSLEVLKATNIGTFSVMPFDVVHDAVDPFGYLIYSKPNRKKILFATDTYYIKHKFRGLTHIMIECNYSNEILKKNIENGLPEAVAKRLFTSHFELSNVIKFLKAQDLSLVEEIYLMHLSDGNSDEKLFKREIQKATGKVVYVCEK